jgi:tetrahydromethanopterin S-methyltransferase subunit C
MDEIRKRFHQLEHKGISVKACVAELIGTGTFVLIGLLVAAYVGNFQPAKGVSPSINDYQLFVFVQ